MISIDDIRRMQREDLNQLAFSLIMKRQYDGLNGRNWDACEHLKWEDIVDSMLHNPSLKADKREVGKYYDDYFNGTVPWSSDSGK